MHGDIGPGGREIGREGGQQPGSHEGDCDEGHESPRIKPLGAQPQPQVGAAAQGGQIDLPRPRQAAGQGIYAQAQQGSQHEPTQRRRRQRHERAWDKSSALAAHADDAHHKGRGREEIAGHITHGEAQVAQGRPPDL